jgi:hypothetical protein
VDVRLLRKLCRQVTPASLRSGAKEARRRTFLVGLRRERGALRLLLDPLPNAAGLRGRAVLDFSEGGRQLWVAGTLSPAAGTGVELVVESGPAERPPRSTRLVAAGDVAFAMCVVAEGGGRQCHPVLDIGTRGFRIETSTPLALGTVLTDLIVVFRQEVLRTGEGVVTSSAPVIYPDGRVLYECGVRHRAADPRRKETAAADVDIDDVARVRAVLWGLCDLEYEVSVGGPTGIVRGRMQQAHGTDRKRAPELRCRVQDADRLPLRSGTVTVECSLFGSGYRFFARVIDRRGDVLTLSPAPRLREWHRRGEERTPLGPGAGATVSFRHPLTGRPRTATLTDMSSQGFSFPAGPLDEEIWSGLPLKQVRITLGDLTFKAADVVVRSVSSRGVSVEMRALAGREADVMRERLIERGPDGIRFHDGRSLDGVIAFHRSMNLLEPDMDANLAASFDEARRSWAAAHDKAAGLMRTAVVPWHGGIGATLTSVRAYERTWLFQHSAVASAAVPAGAGQLHGVLMRLAAHRPDGEYIAGVIDAGARSLHAMVSAFFAESAPAHRGLARLTLYTAPALPGPDGAVPHSGVRRLRGRDELLVEHVGERQLDPVCARALGLRAGEVELPHTRDAYARIGVVRTRQAFGAFAGDRCVGVLLREAASPGLCLSGLLSAAMLLPVSPELDPDGAMLRALGDLARRTPVPGDPPHRFLFLPEGADDRAIVESSSGWRRVAACTFFALHRLGILEYQRYVANKYGLLQARLRGRSARLPEAA